MEGCGRGCLASGGGYVDAMKNIEMNITSSATKTAYFFTTQRHLDVVNLAEKFMERGVKCKKTALQWAEAETPPEAPSTYTWSSGD